jgi:predicted short-subunit dehydrogenase-like oxidoreductase (DUF2520 family)
MFDKKLNIVIIGAGKIAYSLTNALVEANYDVNVIVSKKLSSAKLLARRFSITKFINNFDEIPKNSRIFFISVPDSVIKEVAIGLSKQNFDFQSSLFVHFSGVLSVDVLKDLRNKHSKTASFHILQSFPAKKIQSLKGNYAAIETDEKITGKFLFKLAKDLRLHPFKIKSSEKNNYHLASVFSSNFLAINLFAANQIYNNKNLIELAYPMLLSTLNNAKHLGTSNALSGPIDRGDIDTIKKHLETIKKTKNDISGLIYKSYIIQSLTGLELVKIKYGRLSKKHNEVKKFLLSKL